ncbi:pseudaminic acid cytidylyltransferase [Caldithrix abyssi]|nr:pseudaminic acid cytidylyltransferase [Caldithrix abyssi]
MNVAIIPARGDSKRIPKKNIKEFCGKPMIAYSIEVAKRSGIFEDIIVSTDSREIANIAEEYGAYVPFIRPDALSNDFATTGDVLAHAVRWLHSQNYGELNTVCCIYATAPFILKDNLLEGYKIFKTNNWSYVFSATTFSFPVQRAIKKLDNGGIEMFQPEHYETRSQDLEEGFHDAGQFYFGKPEAWMNKEKIFQNSSEIIVLPNWLVQDIDTYDDWYRAELLFQLIKRDNNG